VYCFIVNEVSGNGRALKVWRKIEKTLQEKEVPYCIHFTKKPKHAICLVQEIIKQKTVTIVVAVGGDGTIHEVINGLIGANINIPLGIIPAGSGNDFSRGLGIPLKHDRALERILNGKPRIIDVGVINSTYFSTVAGIGFDGEVAHKTNVSTYKKLLNIVGMGKVSYIISALHILFRYKPMDLSITIDKKMYKMQKVWLIAVANLPYYGGGLAICPNAVSNDGFFDICVVQGISKWGFLSTFPLAFKGKHTTLPSIKILKGKELEIISPSPILIHGDGEIIGNTPAVIRMKPYGLTVL
jgi:YegS/Rv2252/BmrU family lipid kinase